MKIKEDVEKNTKIVEGHFTLWVNGEKKVDRKNLVVNNARVAILKSVAGIQPVIIDKFQLTKSSKTSVSVDDTDNDGDSANTIDLDFTPNGDGTYSTPNGDVEIVVDIGNKTITYNITIHENQGNNKEFNCASLYTNGVMFNIILFGNEVKTANKEIKVSWTLEF